MRTVPHRQVRRAQIVLQAAEGIANSTFAEQLHCSIPTVLLWRHRYQDTGGVRLGRGRPGTWPAFGELDLQVFTRHRGGAEQHLS
jgi:transposase